MEGNRPHPVKTERRHSPLRGTGADFAKAGSARKGEAVGSGSSRRGREGVQDFCCCWPRRGTHLVSATCCLHLWPRRRHKPSTHLASSTPSLSSALCIPQVASGFQKASLSPFLAPGAAEAGCSQVWLPREAGLHLQSRPGLRRRGPVCSVCAGSAGRPHASS